MFYMFSINKWEAVKKPKLIVKTISVFLFLEIEIHSLKKNFKKITWYD